MIRQLIRDDESELRLLGERLEQKTTTIQRWREKVVELEKSLELARKLEKVAQARVKASRTIAQVINERDLAEAILVTENESNSNGSQVEHESQRYLASTVARYQAELARAQEEKERHTREAEEMTANLVRLEKAVESYSSAIHHATISKQDAQNYSLAVKKSLALKRLLLSAGRRLPTELLFHIFDIALEQEVSAIRDDPSSQPSHLSFILAAVCRGWRQLVLSYTPLWSYIPVFYRVDEARMDIEEVYLQRGGHKDKLILHIPHIVESAPLPLRLNDSLSLSKLLQGAKSLELLGKSPWAVRATGKFRSYSLRNLLPSFNERISAIQSLFLDVDFYITPAEIQTIFRFLNKLQRFHMRTMHWIHAPIGSDSATFTMSDLKEISAIPEVLKILLESYIVAPSLNHIILTAHRPDGVTDTLDQLEGIPSNDTARRLVNLGIGGRSNPEATRDYYLPLLKRAIGIKVLELFGSFFDAILQELADNHQLCSNLQHIIMHEADIPVDTVRNLLQKRKSSMKQLSFHQCRGFGRDACEELAQMVELHVYS